MVADRPESDQIDDAASPDGPSDDLLGEVQLARMGTDESDSDFEVAGPDLDGRNVETRSGDAESLSSAGTVPWWMAGGKWVVGNPGTIDAVMPLPAPPWSRPDYASDGAAISSLAFCAASTRGISHQLYGKPRQDAYGYSLTRSGKWLVGCVADGVSQGKRSHFAADIACKEIVLGVSEWAEGQEIPSSELQWLDISSTIPWQESVDASSRAIVDEATRFARAVFTDRGDTVKADILQQNQLSDSDAAKIMATTAIGFLVGTTRNAEGLMPFALAVGAGDSSAFILSRGVWSSITAIKNLGAEIASSAVRALPARQVAMAHTGFLALGEALVVVTDGIGDPLGSGTGVVGRFLAESWVVPCDPLAFVAHVGFVRKTFIDDRTAFVVWHASS